MKYLFVFLLSMVPIFELRGAIPVAIGMGLAPIPAIAICAIGNLVPVPVIYMFARKVLIWGLDKPYIGGICHFFHDKGEKAGRKLAEKAGSTGMILALMLFVGIPIPGTGAWTGTLGASFLNLGPKKTAFSVCSGVILAAAIMSILSLIGVNVLTV